MTELQTVPEGISTLKHDSNNLCTQANLIIISNDEQYNQAVELVKSINVMEKEIKNSFKPLKSQANKLHSSICTEEKRHINPLDSAKVKVKSVIGSYLNMKQEQERIERERQEALRIKEAESERLKEAELLEMTGREKEAESVLNEPVAIEPIKVEKRPSDGISIRKIWKARVIDKSLIPVEYLSVDLAKLNSVARATQGEMKIMGVEFYYETSTSVRV